MRKICVVGLGYVGLPLAVEFSKQDFEVIGFDINENKIKELKDNIDSMDEISKEQLEKVDINYSSDPADIKNSDFIIVAVPTPVTKSNRPKLDYLRDASALIGKNLAKGSIVVYESTVYPGVTEEVCKPVLEENSGLECGKDFKIGYSPERINPGDKEHTIDKIIKIVSGIDEESLNIIADTYSKVAKAGVFKAKNIKTAEAAKVIENIQRDLNIALVNELALIFDRIGIRTKDVLDAAGTKWNFHKYFPSIGPGGHCIPVDPYYLTFKAEQLGYIPQVILSGRKVNNYMAKHVAELVIKGLNQAGKVPKDSKVVLLGLTFKENVKDSRNSRTGELIKSLKEYGINVIGHDPLLDNQLVKDVFDVENKTLDGINDSDCVVLVTLHDEIKDLDLEKLKDKMNKNPLIVDTKSFFDEDEALKKGFIYKAL